MGQLLVNQSLPPDLRDYNRVLDKKGVQQLLDTVARKYPEKYAEIAKNLSDVGRKVAYHSGGFGVGLDSLRQTQAAKIARINLARDLQQVYSNRSLTPDQADAAVLETVGKYQQALPGDVFKEAVAANNPLALQAVSGARGSQTNVNSLIGADLLYEDHRGRPVPIPILRNYAMGLSPAEHFAGAFGARKGTLDLKKATADAGFLSKQLAQSVHRLLVTAQDSDSPYDESQPRGLEVETNDADNEGSLLAHPVGGYGRNTVLTPKILKELSAAGHANILVRSPTVGGPDDGGVYSRDTGYREKGGLAPRGDMVGLAGSQAICLAEGTMVRMADGTVKAIEQLVPGDSVLGCNVDGVTKAVVVTHVFDNGTRDCYDTTFRQGTGRTTTMLHVRSTLQHKILSVVSTPANRHPAATIRPIAKPDGNSRFYAMLPTAYDDSDCKPEPFALALGLLIGDGCYTVRGAASNGVKFSCYDPTLIDDISCYFHDIGCTLVPQSDPREFRVTSHAKGKRSKGQPTNQVRNSVRGALLKYGMWGQRSHLKTLPDTADWDNASVAALAAGLIATDGCVHVTTSSKKSGSSVIIQFGSTSLAVATGLRSLLQTRFGIFPSNVASNCKKREDGSDYRPMYSWAIIGRRSVERFAECISIPGVKGPRLRTALANIPRPVKTTTPGRCAIVSQTHYGECRTFDIAVDNRDHLFVLENGLVVSNSEPVTQGQISSKHSGGVAGASAGAIGGFAAINAMVQAPEIFPGGAVHSQMDGRVEHIVEAPQGGHYMTVGGQQHYIPRGATMTVQKGDTVEAGDVVTEGIPNPSEIVRHKGVGEGRRYFIDSFRKVLKNSQIGAHRRNVELLARGLLNHVRLTDEVGDWGPDDVVPYQTLESQWTPRAGYMVAPAKSLVGHYLEKPILHYSVGTKIRPSMVQKLDQYGVKSIYAHRDAPPFEPEMVRAMMNTAHDPDWQTKMLGSYQQSSVLEAARRGGMSDNDSTSYVPSLASSPTFGSAKIMKGWNPADIGRTPVDLAAKPKITSLLD